MKKNTKKYMLFFGLLYSSQNLLSYSNGANDAFLWIGSGTLIASAYNMLNLYQTKSNQESTERNIFNNAKGADHIKNFNLKPYGQATLFFGGCSAFGLLCHRVNPNLSATLTPLAVGTTALFSFMAYDHLCQARKTAFDLRPKNN